MNRDEAYKYAQQFVENLLEYVVLIAGKDYESSDKCIENIAGDEVEFWKAFDLIAS